VGKFIIFSAKRGKGGSEKKSLGSMAEALRSNPACKRKEVLGGGKLGGREKTFSLDREEEGGGNGRR